MARGVPFAIKYSVKQEIDNSIKKGILELVNESTDRVHPIVTVIKPNASIRLCMDHKDLCLRENIIRCPLWKVHCPIYMTLNILPY